MPNAKRETLEELLRTTWAYLHIDGRVDGVDLPEWLKEPAVKLQIGYDMPLPIHDLTVDDTGVVATLSFRRVPHRCVMPWRSIYAITDLDGKGVMFPEDVPAEVAGAFAMPSAPATKPDARSDAKPDARSDAKPDAKPEPAPAKKSRPSHLKLVP